MIKDFKSIVDKIAQNAYLLIANGATLKCPEGSKESHLNVTENRRGAVIEGKLLATIMDHKANVNILPFGNCSRLGGSPCTPKTETPWEPGALKAEVNTFPLLTKNSTCYCSLGAKIFIVDHNHGKESKAESK